MSKSNVDRRIWKTALELKDEFGYVDPTVINKIARDNRVSTSGDPKSRREPFYYNREEFIRIPQIIDRLISNEDIEAYNKEVHLSGDWMVTGDWHIPYHDPDLALKMLAVAKKFNIKRGLCAGDFGDQSAFSQFIDKKDAWTYEKKKTRNVLYALFSWFDEWFMHLGNHGLRMWKKAAAAGNEEDIFEMIKTAEMADRMKYSTYPYCIINESWLIAHPASYSRIQTRNAYFLASKYLPPLIEKGQSPNGIYGIITFHGHQGGEGTDVSSRFQTVDGMGMMDPAKVKYKKMRLTTHPEWVPGFSMLRKNHLYRFPKDSTDWNFWLDEIEIDDKLSELRIDKG